MKILRFFVFFICAFFVLPLAAQDDFRKLSPEDAKKVLSEFRAYRMAGDFCMKFEITHYLRKSDETETCTGTLYGTWEKGAPILRIEITNGNGEKSFLLIGGNAPELWTLDSEKRPVRMDKNSTEPFFENLIFTPFELQTPFVYWENAQYERTRRFRGRPVHFFKMTPPESFLSENSDVGFVRIGFDRVYNALVSAEVFDAAGKLKKTFSLSRVQKVQEQYTIRELELRDDKTRDKDEFVVTAAALNLRFPRSVFTPEGLAEAAPIVPAAYMEKL
ncbi:MAG: outer membrane lipoprotein-sorting protein [Opitutales bacterium]|nr:outer membrane lipoprotein-sorting protein [Opitutales bacterium]